jgi:hypothetical protein
MWIGGPVLLGCQQEHTPILVPIVSTAWGVLVWFTGGRQMIRDPRAEIRAVAEARARGRILHPRGGGDVEKEFEQQSQLRWISVVVCAGWLAGMGYAWYDALFCRRISSAPR